MALRLQALFGTEGGLSVNRPLAAEPTPAPAKVGREIVNLHVGQAGSRSLAYNRPLDANNESPQLSQMAPAPAAYVRPLDAAPPQQAAPGSVAYRRPLDAGNQMQQQALPASISYTRPLGADMPPMQMRSSSLNYARPLDGNSPSMPSPPVMVQPAMPSVSYTRPLDAGMPDMSMLSNFSAPSIEFRVAKSALSNIATPARSYQRPLDSQQQRQTTQPAAQELLLQQQQQQPSGVDDYWGDVQASLAQQQHRPGTTLPPPVLIVPGASQYLFGSSYMPENSLYTPDQIEFELKNLKDLLDSGFLQGFQFEERKAELIRQKKFAFVHEVPNVQFGELTANVILDSMDDAPASLKKIGANRNVRVFISSTFRDMGDEREALLKHVFPQVQKTCRERGVFLTAVDLRWGITSEQTSNAQTINVCLSEIDRCRPYFITMLGGRYGWAQPETGVDDLLKRTHDRGAESFPWIRKFSNRSVTELEIRHALLNDIDSDTARRGLVYLRKDAQDDDIRLTHLKKELVDLKNQGGLRVVNHYSNAEDLKRILTNDLMKMLDEDFSLSETPSPLERERQAHEAFADSRCRIYTSRPASFSSLNSHLLNPASGPIVVVGDAGVGKSAFLCNWAWRYKRDNPEKLVITHYIGATSASSDLSQMLTRIMMEINQFYQLGKGSCQLSLNKL